MTVKCKWDKPNNFFKGSKPTCPYDVYFFRILHDMWEANVNEVNATFFVSTGSPLAPMIYFFSLFVKIAWGVRVKHKWDESNFFVSTASPAIHMTFFVKIGWCMRVKYTQGEFHFFTSALTLYFSMTCFWITFLQVQRVHPRFFAQILWRVSFKW